MKSTFARNLSLLFLVVLPVAFVPLSITGFDVVKSLVLAGFVVVISVAALFKRLGDPASDAKVTLFSALALGAALSTALSAAFSPVPLLSWYGDGIGSEFALLSLALLGVFVAFSAVVRTVNVAARVVVFALASWAVVLAWEVIRYVLNAAGLPIPSFGYFLSSGANTVGRVSDLSLFLALGVAILVAVDRVTPLRGWQAYLMYGSVTLAGILMFFIKFTLSWYLLAAVGLCIVCHALAFDKERRVPPFALSVVLASFAMILGGQVAIDGMYTAIDSPSIAARIDPYVIVADDVRPNFQTTLSLAGRVLRESPVFGAGPARFSRELHESGYLGGMYLNGTPLWNDDFFAGHSNMTTRLVNEGVLGFVMWASLILAVAYFALRYSCVAHRDPTKRTAALVAATTAVFAAGTFFFYPPSAVVSAILLALMGSAAGLMAADDAVPAKPISSTANRRLDFLYAFALVIGLLVVLAFGFAWAKRVAATHFTGTATREAASGDGQAAVLELAKSAYFVPDSGVFRSASDVQRMMALQIIGSESAEARAQEAAQLAIDSVENARKAIAADSTHYANYLALARSLMLGGTEAYPVAFDTYEAAKPLASRNPTILLEQAVVAAISGKRAEALALVEGALIINPEIADARELRESILSMQETVVDVESVVASSTDANPEDESATSTEEGEE